MKTEYINKRFLLDVPGMSSDVDFYEQIWQSEIRAHDNGFLRVDIRFDDDCNNGYATFSVTADYFERGRIVACGRLHNDIVKTFPELVPLLQYHLTSTDGPMHYIANTVYHAGDAEWNGEQKPRNLDAARDSAVWLDASDEELSVSEKGLTYALEARLPALLQKFKLMVTISCGFKWLEKN